MQVTVSAHHTEVPPALRQMAEEKIAHLSRLFPGMDRAEVHFDEEHNPRIADREICEVTMEGHGHRLFAKVTGPDGYVCVDRAVDKMERKLHKLKTRVLLSRHGGEKKNTAHA
jgi:putative sigma-54 modulation protein